MLTALPAFWKMINTNPSSSLALLDIVSTHTHTHTHIYIFIVLKYDCYLRKETIHI